LNTDLGQSGAAAAHRKGFKDLVARVTLFLQAVAPVEIDALSRARKAHLQSEKDLRHAEEQQIERLRYQATLAERQFNRSIPITGWSPAN